MSIYMLYTTVWNASQIAIATNWSFCNIKVQTKRIFWHKEELPNWTDLPLFFVRGFCCFRIIINWAYFIHQHLYIFRVVNVQRTLHIEAKGISEWKLEVWCGVVIYILSCGCLLSSLSLAPQPPPPGCKPPHNYTQIFSLLCKNRMKTKISKLSIA